jgi:CubicO group peptidase (beta-lactamase class C family)/acetyl esterase/lipase
MSRTLIWASSFLAVAALAGFAFAGDADQFDGIRDEIQRRLVQQSVPSVTVAVARADRIVWEEGFGWADRENGLRATPHTPYTLGSLSKPVTATALMVLAERKVLALDKPINDYLGDAKVRARVGDASEVSLQRVAQHTAGLPGYYETFYPDEPDTPPTPEVVTLRYGFTVFPPGERFYYSNLNYALLGEAVARASGKGFGDFLREEVLLPLGMHRSGVPLGPGLLQFRAIRYGLDRQRLPDYVTPHAPASDIYASAHDLARFGMFHLKAHLADQKPILQNQSIDMMQRLVVPMGDEQYGIGWHIRQDAKGRQQVLHGGAAAGVDAQLTLVPEEKLCVAVLANVTRDWPGAVTEHVTNAILANVLGGEPGDFPMAPGPSASSADSGLPGKLRGTWTGMVHTSRQDVPVTLWFQESGDVHAQLGDQLKTLVNDARFSGRQFTGKIAGDIGTPDANRRPYHLQWDVTLRDGQLAGALSAVGRHPSRGLSLAHWVELRKQAERTDDAPAIVILKDVPYDTGTNADPERNKLDLYLPQARKDFPVLFWVHGGGLRTGDRKTTQPLGETFARQGIGFVTTGYRLSPAVKHPAHIEDVARAFAWTVGNIARHGGRADAVFVSGHSSGGQLAALLATDESYLKAHKLSFSNIKGVISISGPQRIEFSEEWTDTFGATPEAFQNASPVQHVGPRHPPFLILVAENDDNVCRNSSVELGELLTKRKIEATLVEVKDRDHGSIIRQIPEAGDPAANAILEFVRRQCSHSRSAK